MLAALFRVWRYLVPRRCSRCRVMCRVVSAAGWVSRLVGRPLCVRWAAARPRDRHTRVCGSERSISRPALALPSEPGPPSPEPGPVAASAWPCSQVTLSIEARLVFLSVASQGLLAALRTCGSSVATISLRIETVAACVGVSWHRIETAGTSVAQKWQLLAHSSPTEAVRVSCGCFDASTEVQSVSSSRSTVPTVMSSVSSSRSTVPTVVSLVSSSRSTVPTVVSLVSRACR